MKKGKQSKIVVPEELKDFRNFVYLAWEHLGLPDPTKVQYDISKYLQHGPRRKTICAFRGVGKSYLTSAYVVWKLLLNPDINVLVVSASKTRSDDFSTFTQRLIAEMPILEHLRPRKGQRDSKIAFDVGPASAAHAPSVKSVGITGQLTGSRADIIVADDVESLNNSATQGMREKLSELVKEFEAIIKPGGEITFLGTYQTEMSLYTVLPDRGYETRIWPARYPADKKLPRYGSMLAPLIYDELAEDPTLESNPTDPRRFDDWELKEREASYGRSGFAMQFMLDPSLSDAERYPLKLSDLVVMDINSELAPEKVIHSSAPDKQLPDLPVLGFAGDHFYQPMQVIGDWVKYKGSVMAIDPSGRGSDETSYAIVNVLNGFLWVLECSGVEGGYQEETMQTLVDIAKKNQVKQILIESNFGDGMFTELLKPYLRKTYPVTTEEVRHHTQKEKRIIDTLEPVMNQHKLIVSPQLIEKDFESTKHLPPEKAPQYRLFHQMTRITKDRGALLHDDRLDALSMAVQYWVEAAGRDADEAIKDAKQEKLDRSLEKFMEDAVGQPYPKLPTWF